MMNRSGNGELKSSIVSCRKKNRVYPQPEQMKPGDWDEVQIHCKYQVTEKRMWFVDNTRKQEN